jgi:DNA-binding response OmpR family regulator
MRPASHLLMTEPTQNGHLANADPFQFGPYRLDLKKRRLLCGQAEVPINRNEYLLLRILALHRGQVVPRRRLMQAVWGTATIGHGVLDTLAETLREKLAADQPCHLASPNPSGYSLSL